MEIKFTEEEMKEMVKDQVMYLLGKDPEVTIDVTISRSYSDPMATAQIKKKEPVNIEPITLREGEA